MGPAWGAGDTGAVPAGAHRALSGSETLAALEVWPVENGKNNQLPTLSSVHPDTVKKHSRLEAG